MYVWGRGEYTGGHSVGSADTMPLMHVLEGVAVCGHAVCVCVYVCMYVCVCMFGGDAMADDTRTRRNKNIT